MESCDSTKGNGFICKHFVISIMSYFVLFVFMRYELNPVVSMLSVMCLPLAFIISEGWLISSRLRELDYPRYLTGTIILKFSSYKMIIFKEIIFEDSLVFSGYVLFVLVLYIGKSIRR